MERAPLARRALDPEVAIHELDQLHRDRKSQTSATVSAGGGSVSLTESCKNLLLFFDWYPYPRVTDDEVQLDVRFFERLNGDDNDDFTLLGEFECISHEVDHDLSQSPRIADEGVGHIRRDEVGQFHTFFGGLQTEGVHGIAQAVAEEKINRLQFQFSGFHLGEVENVVEQPQQCVSRLQHDVQILSLLVRKRRLKGQL